MSEFEDIFTSDLATGVFIWASFAMLSLYAVAAIWIFKSKRARKTTVGDGRSTFMAPPQAAWRIQNSSRS